MKHFIIEYKWVIFSVICAIFAVFSAMNVFGDEKLEKFKKDVQLITPRRAWVNDVKDSTVWYYGYYRDGNFYYNRREVHGLSDFRSLYSMSYQYVDRSRPSVQAFFEAESPLILPKPQQFTYPNFKNIESIAAMTDELLLWQNKENLTDEDRKYVEWLRKQVEFKKHPSFGFLGGFKRRNTPLEKPWEHPSPVKRNKGK